MSKKKLLLIVAALLVFLFVLITVLAASVYMAKEDKWIFKDSSEDEDVVEDDADDAIDVSEQNVYAIANCKLYELSEAGAAEIAFTNTTNVDCFDKKLFKGNYATISPDYDSLILLADSEQDDKFIIDVENAQVRQVEFNYDNAHSVVYNPVNGKLYSYLSDDGVYEGTFDNPLQDKIYTLNSTIFGRGGIFSEDFRMRVSPDGTMLLIQDTFTSENNDGSEFTSLKVIDINGDLVYERRASFAQFIDDNRIIYSTTDSMGGGGEGDVIAFDLDSAEETALGIGAYAYNIDVVDGHILVDYFESRDSLVVGNMRTVILNSETYDEEDSVSLPVAYNLILNENVIIGKKSFDCAGEWDDAASANPCPFEGPYGFYEESIDSVNLDTDAETVLKEFDTATQPRFID